MKMNAFRIMTYPYIAWITAMIVIPMILILFYAFTIEGNDVVSIKFSLENFTRFVTDTTFLRVVGKSLWIAFLTTIISIIMGYPVAYIISKARGNHGIILILLLTLPTWINMLVRTYAWMGILQEGGMLSKLLAFLGFPGVSLLYTDFAVTLGMVYNFLPFMILQIHTSLAKMDNSLLEAAVRAAFRAFGASHSRFHCPASSAASRSSSCLPSARFSFQSSWAAANTSSSGTSSKVNF